VKQSINVNQVPERSSDQNEHAVTITRGFSGTNPAAFSGATNLPVESVNWFDATNYCGLLTQRQLAAGLIPTGWSYRLPTEAEWEYACRTNCDPSGTLVTPKTAFANGPALLGFMANFASTNEYETSLGTLSFQNTPYFAGRTVGVGTYQPSSAALFDMHGNVGEWCQDWYGLYDTNIVVDPKGPTTGMKKVRRGGSWLNVGRDCRAGSRDYCVPTNFVSNIGFRVVLADH
jgi:formylglycine-generating enzyme required for sulfatase activity